MMSNKTSDQSQNICSVTADNGNYTMTFFSPATSSGSARNGAQMWTGFSFPNLNERRRPTLELCHPTAGDAFWQTFSHGHRAFSNVFEGPVFLKKLHAPCHTAFPTFECASVHLLNRNLQYAPYNAHSFCTVHGSNYSNVSRGVPRRASARNQGASLVLSSYFLDVIPEGKEAYSKNTCQILQKPGLKGLREMSLKL